MIDDEPEWTWWNKFSDNPQWYRELPCGCKRNILHDLYSLSTWKITLEKRLKELHVVNRKDGILLKRETCGTKIGRRATKTHYLCEECCKRFTLIQEWKRRTERIIKDEDVVFERE